MTNLSAPCFIFNKVSAWAVFGFQEPLNVDGLVKSPTPSLRGATRRGNLSAIQGVMRLSRFARNDISAFFGLFTNASRLIHEGYV
jgi:hypothetical protein